MMRTLQNMKSPNYYGEKPKELSSLKKSKGPRSHIHIPFPRSLDPEEIAEAFSKNVDEALSKMSIENNKASLEESLSQKPSPKRIMKI